MSSVCDVAGIISDKLFYMFIYEAANLFSGSTIATDVGEVWCFTWGETFVDLGQKGKSTGLCSSGKSL